MRVLVGTDGSEDSKAAIEWLPSLPLPASTRVRVVTAVVLPPSALDIPTVHEYYEGLREAGTRIVEASRQTLAARWPEVETAVLEGDPRTRLIEAANDWQPDLLVVGARGLSPFKAALLGSVSTTVVHDATCPVLVVKGRPRKLAHVLVAVDGSEDSVAAVRFLASLPLDRSLHVRLLAVADLPPATMAPPELLGTPIAVVTRSIAEERRDLLAGVLSRLQEDFRDAIGRLECSVVIGRPAVEIISAASEADLAVVGARGLGRVQRLLLGSVSDRVLHHAQCPVLVVKRPRP